MSKNLALLLGEPERLVSRAVKKLEDMNGFPAEDAKLLAENSQVVRQKITDLGLDADDTTGEELYQALLARYERDSSMIDKALGVSQDTPAVTRMQQAANLVGSILQSDNIWVLKHNSAKKMLRAQPPKKLMKQLNYRSIESLLKRENLAVVYSAVQYTESSAWQKSFSKAIAQLPTAEYELKAPEVVIMDPVRWGGVKHGGNSVTSSSYAGAVALWPAASQAKTPVLTLSLKLLDGLEELTGSPAQGSLADVNPALIWWEQAHNLVAACGGQAVSFNYKDVAANHMKNTAYRKRTADKGQTSLWEELVSRYQNQTEQLEESVTEAGQRATKSLAVEYAEAIANEF